MSAALQGIRLTVNNLLLLRLFFNNMVFQVRAELDEDEIPGKLWVLAEHLFPNLLL